MKRIVFLVIAVAATVIAAVLSRAYSRPLEWPQRIRAVDWRRLTAVGPTAPDVIPEGAA